MDPIRIVIDQGGGDQGLQDGGADAQVSDMGDVGDQGPDGGAPDLGPSIVLEVGFGPTGSFMVAPGTGLAMAVMGVQGGYHLDMGFRVRGLTAADFNSGDWIIRYAYRTAEGTALSDPISRVLSLAGVSFDGTGQVRTGDRVFFISNDPSAFDNTAITLEVSLTRGSLVIVDTAQVTLSVP